MVRRWALAVFLSLGLACGTLDCDDDSDAVDAADGADGGGDLDASAEDAADEADIAGETRQDPDAADIDGADDWPAFALGIEYMQLGLADVYTDAGVTWAKTRLEVFTWNAIEPAPPVDGVHTYDWSCADAMIREYQEAGIVNIQSYLSPRSLWGSVGVSDLGDTDIMPSAEHIDDYRAWIRAMIERYDGDGRDDMPGLLAPVRYWVMGPEWTGFWPGGNHDDYLLFAQVTAEEARAAYPDVRLGTIPILFMDVFSGNEPSAEEIEVRLEASYAFRNPTAGVYAILDRPELFDYISIHSLEDYTEVAPTLAWFRDQMDQRGYRLPLWFDDAFPMGGLANNLDFPALYPVTEQQQDAVWSLLSTIAKADESADPPYSVAVAWLRALAASGTVKKVVSALGEGAAGIQIGNTEDWMADEGQPALRESFMAFLGASAAFGMVDVDHRNRYGECAPRFPGDPRPAYRNLELLVDKLGDGDFDAVERVGANEGVRGYRFERGGVSLWVLWNEDGVLELPGDPPEEPVTYRLEVAGDVTEVRVTHSVTDIAAPMPLEEILAVSGGHLELSLTSVPMFVEPL